MEDDAASTAITENEKTLYQAFRNIMNHAKPEKFILLSKLICDVAEETSFGDVRIIVVQGWIEQIKVMKSYK